MLPGEPSRRCIRYMKAGLQRQAGWLQHVLVSCPSTPGATTPASAVHFARLARSARSMSGRLAWLQGEWKKGGLPGSSCDVSSARGPRRMGDATNSVAGHADGCAGAGRAEAHLLDDTNTKQMSGLPRPHRVAVRPFCRKHSVR